MAITGNGNATKEQVAKMLQLLGLNYKNLDSTDGLAAAVCHFSILEKWLERKAIRVGMLL
jgi:Holliday junction resolvasome RuvABC endonuclease subunit